MRLITLFSLILNSHCAALVKASFAVGLRVWKAMCFSQRTYPPAASFLRDSQETSPSGLSV